LLGRRIDNYGRSHYRELVNKKWEFHIDALLTEREERISAIAESIVKKQAEIAGLQTTLGTDDKKAQQEKAAAEAISRLEGDIANLNADREAVYRNIQKRYDQALAAKVRELAAIGNKGTEELPTNDFSLNIASGVNDGKDIMQEVWVKLSQMMRPGGDVGLRTQILEILKALPADVRAAQIYALRIELREIAVEADRHGRNPSNREEFFKGDPRHAMFKLLQEAESAVGGISEEGLTVKIKGDGTRIPMLKGTPVDIKNFIGFDFTISQMKRNQTAKELVAASAI
jgi:hypothetical protein